MISSFIFRHSIILLLRMTFNTHGMIRIGPKIHYEQLHVTQTVCYFFIVFLFTLKLKFLKYENTREQFYGNVVNHVDISCILWAMLSNLSVATSVQYNAEKCWFSLKSIPWANKTQQRIISNNLKMIFLV